MVDALRLSGCHQLQAARGKRFRQHLPRPVREIVVVGKAAVEIAAEAKRMALFRQASHILHLRPDVPLERRPAVSINTAQSFFLWDEPVSTY